MKLLLSLLAGFSLFLGENGIKLSMPELEPARPIASEFCLEASPEVIDGYWNTYDVDCYSIPKDSIPERTFIRTDGGFSCPYGRKVFSSYGHRRGRNHDGVDLPLPAGTNVTAAFDGVVRVSCYHKGYGNIIIIRHPNGLETCYAHLAKRKVKSGDRVDVGQVIATSGSTGRSTGPHLHFEVLYCGHSFDPESIIDFKDGTLLQSPFLLKREMLY